MTAFKPFDEKGTPIDEQWMSWSEMVKEPYDRDRVDAYTRCRTILMNGIENNSILMSHAMDRMLDNNEVKEKLAAIRRADSQHQTTVNWLNPADQSIIETTIGFEQVAVDLTANLAKNEPDGYSKQVLDYALIEDFDHLYRYSSLMELLENQDAESIVQHKTDIMPGRPTAVEHRAPVDEMRKHMGRDADIKSILNNITIVSGEQQTMLFYKSHGFMYADDLARRLYAEIAEIEEQHVSQYEMVGYPGFSMLEKMALIQLNEAYNYYSCAQTEPDSRIREIWMRFMKDEITHFNMCNELLQKYENKSAMDLMKTDKIEPLVVFEPNKEYVKHIVETQVDLMPYNMEFVDKSKLPKDWATFAYRDKVNAGGAPSEEVIERARERRKALKPAAA